jgi:hypothetical protein
MALALAPACPAAAGVFGDRYRRLDRAARTVQRMLWLWRGRVARRRAREAKWLTEFMGDCEPGEIPAALLAMELEFGDEADAGEGQAEAEALLRLRLATAASHHPDITIEAFRLFDLHCELRGAPRAEGEDASADRWLFEALDGGRHGRDSLPNMVALTLGVECPNRFRGHPTMFDALKERILTRECLEDAAEWAAECCDSNAACPLAAVYMASEEGEESEEGDDSEDSDDADGSDDADEEDGLERWRRAAAKAATGVLADVRATWFSGRGWPEFLKSADARGRYGEELMELVERG